jgi:hypothetical protein
VVSLFQQSKKAAGSLYAWRRGRFAREIVGMVGDAAAEAPLLAIELHVVLGFSSTWPPVWRFSNIETARILAYLRALSSTASCELTARGG